jgi:hypothetical protein
MVEWYQKRVTLEESTRIVPTTLSFCLLRREETGHYLSPVDPVPSYAQRGLPPSNLNDGYKVYQWIKPWDAGAGTITASKVAPAFESQVVGHSTTLPGLLRSFSRIATSWRSLSEHAGAAEGAS